jgi:hypothetical protein
MLLMYVRVHLFCAKSEAYCKHKGGQRRRLSCVFVGTLRPCIHPPLSVPGDHHKETGARQPRPRLKES